MDVLIIEDCNREAQFVNLGLTRRGWRCKIAPSAEDAIEKMSRHKYDIAVVDVKLPEMSGFELVRQLRAREDPLPVIFLSGFHSPADKITGLNLGADDYLAKPFEMNELIARIESVTRRTKVQDHARTLAVKDLTLDLETHKANRGGREIILTQMEYAILEYLMRNKGRTLSAKMILHDVWGIMTTRETTAVETRICLLRKKISEKGEPELIHTVKGFGYVAK